MSGAGGQAGKAAPAALQRIYSVAAMRTAARRILPLPVFDFADGGAEDERTLRRNEAAFDDVALLPRPLNGAAIRDLSVTLFGARLSMPLGIGPTGLSGLFWPGGECASARAASAAGVPYIASHASVCALEDIAATGAAPRWMQVFVYTDRGFTREMIDRAATAGYGALVLTVDNQLLGNRERDIRNGFTIPPRFGVAGTLAAATKAAWLMRMRPSLPTITFGNYLKPGEDARLAAIASRMAGLLDPSLSWKEVDWIRSFWKGPLLLKGILHPVEAAEAVAHGVDGIIVSNHGGRQLDGAAASLDALPAVAAAVDRRIPVLVDGGIRRGADVVKALALGAYFCLIGRPQLWGLAVAGEAGVRHVLELYRTEIDRVMGLMGARTVSELGPDCLMRRNGASPLGARPPAVKAKAARAPARNQQDERKR
ncbi:alpha-hydroxy acid oxidase [Arvimicrobium flavum]|uniref:alpha-hydroxy acid oxidase n=1 Tax=Arvimicrobium flavum TaxID=3393320 RepID=UPI00237A615A|nr:alpha-hydroxy acid oxidase [Mesorhizobium shangrilense]